jgi:hypothetical protein
MLIDLAARISIFFGSFKISLGNPLFWIGVVIILLFLLRQVGIKKLLSLSIIVSILLFLMFKVDGVIVNYFGKEDGNFCTVLTKPLFIFIIAVVFVYYIFLSKE